MDWFYWLFPPIMTAAPLAMVWFAERTLPPAPTTPFRRWGKIALPTIAFGIIAIYLFALWSFGPQTLITHGLGYLYFPVWGLAMALTIRPNSNVGERNFGRVERTASLVRRRRESPLSRVWWIGAWLLTGLGSAALVVTAWKMQAPGLALASCIGFAAFALFSLALTHTTLPMTLEEPEPLGVEENPELEKQYAQFRNQRAWMFYGMFAVAMPILLLGMGAGSLLTAGSRNSGATLGVVGGVLGSLFGLAGAAFGVGADLKRKRLAQTLQRTEGR